MYCSLRSSTKRCLCFRYLAWFQCVTVSRILHSSSSLNLLVNEARIGFVLFPCNKSYSSHSKSTRSISANRVSSEGRIDGGAEAIASSRENTSFFMRYWVVPSADRPFSLKVGCSINCSRDSVLSELSQVPCFVRRSSPCCLPFLPVTGSLPQST